MRGWGVRWGVLLSIRGEWGEGAGCRSRTQISFKTKERRPQPELLRVLREEALLPSVILSARGLWAM